MRLIIDIPVEVYEHIKNGELIPVNWDEHIYKAIADGEVSDGEVTEDGNVLKKMSGDHVTYKIEYLMKNLAREIYLLESYMRWKRENVANNKEDNK